MTISLAIQTMYADLQQQCLDAAFDKDFAENGSFSQQVKNGRSYYYYSGYDRGGRKATKYAGPADDPDVADRVARFGQIKTNFRERRQTVRALIAGGLPALDPLAGSILDALAKAGLFRLRACLVGTMAFQAYAALLGVRLPRSQMRTSDADVAQFLSISTDVGDSTPSMIDLLHAVDPSFVPVTTIVDKTKVVGYKNIAGFKVEFLVPNRGSDDYAAHPPIMPALGGASAQPLRFLDFLIRDPVRATLLYNAGIPVSIPSPARYAVHKLILATRRGAGDMVKIEKDLAQAGSLIEAMATNRHHDLMEAWAEAWDRGDTWKRSLVKARSMLPIGHQRLLFAAIENACAEGGERSDSIGFGD